MFQVKNPVITNHGFQTLQGDFNYYRKILKTKLVLI